MLALTGNILIFFSKEVLESASLVAAIIRLLGMESEIDQVPNPLISKKAAKAIDQAVYDRTNGLFEISLKKLLQNDYWILFIMKGGYI